MKAGAKSLRFLGEEKKISIPFFQRRYVWDEGNWKELIETFQNHDVMPFLGSIILKAVDSKESTVVDGQQRLTTITILAKAIYDSLSDASRQPGSGIRNCIENFLFYRKNSADDFADSFVRIEHSRSDRKDYNTVIESRMLHDIDKIDLDTINESSSNVLRCYKYYMQKLYGQNDDDLKNLFNSIFDENRKVFVLIELENGDVNEQTIFDTINRAGIRLSTADIIKNNFYKKLLDASPSDLEAVESCYSENWEKVFYKNKHESDLWDTERVFGNVKHNNLEFLLYCVACIKWGESGDMFSKLENVFDRQTEQLGYNELKELAKEIKEYALIFRKYVLAFKEDVESDDKNVYFKYDDSVRRLLLILQKFGVQMFYPYVIKRLYEVNQDESDASLKDDFHILESFVMRRKISSKGTNDYTSKCYDIIKNGILSLVKSDLSKDDMGISDFDVKTYLMNTKDDSARMILFWIELYRRNSASIDVDALEYKFTLEHIMPRKWDSHWRTVPIYDGTSVLDPASEEGKAYRESFIQSIGNKTLLTSALNSSVRNSSFSEKVMGVGSNKPGYKNHTSLLLTKEIVDNYSTDNEWDEAHIAKRANQLYSEFVKLWPNFKELVTSEQQTTASADDTMDYTDEQLADPVALLKAMDTRASIDETDGMISVAELIRMVNVQSETIDKYIREGTIVPDLVVPVSEHRSNKFFKLERINEYATQFGWSIITDTNKKDVFVDFISRMDMTYSYKPVFVKALFEQANAVGEVPFSKVVTYFLNYYRSRKDQGIIAEKPNSVFSKENTSFSEAEDVIRTYPYKRFYDMAFIHFDSENDTIRIDNTIWNDLSSQEKTDIIGICNEKIKNYFKALVEHENQ